MDVPQRGPGGRGAGGGSLFEADLLLRDQRRGSRSPVGCRSRPLRSRGRCAKGLRPRNPSIFLFIPGPFRPKLAAIVREGLKRGSLRPDGVACHEHSIERVVLASPRGGARSGRLSRVDERAGAQAQWFSTDAALPPMQVERMVQASGYRLTGPVVRNGPVYLADVLGREDDRERLVIEANSGRLLQRYRAAGRRQHFATNDYWSGEPRPRLFGGWFGQDDDLRHANSAPSLRPNGRASSASSLRNPTDGSAAMKKSRRRARPPGLPAAAGRTRATRQTLPPRRPTPRRPISRPRRRRLRSLRHPGSRPLPGGRYARRPARKAAGQAASAAQET